MVNEILETENPDYLCVVLPTAVFVDSYDIKKSFELFNIVEIDAVITFCRYPHPIERAFVFNDYMEMKYTDHAFTQTQGLRDSYYDAGQFYWGVSDAWREERPLFSHKSAPVILPRHRVQDIDTPEDWVRAELMFELLQKLQD